MEHKRLVPELRFPGFKGEWEVKKLGEIGEKVNKKNKDNLIQTVFTNSARFGVISQNDYFNHDVANKNNLEGYYIVRKDDFVYNPRVSNIAPVGPIKRNKLGIGVMSPLYTVFSLNEGVKEFYEYYYETSFWHKYMKGIANYGARHDRMNVLGVDFFSMPLPFPTPPEQTRISTFLTTVDSRISLLEQKKSALLTYKKGMMQKLFSQEVRFKDKDGKDFPDWEEKKLGEVVLSYKLGGNYDNSEYATAFPLIKMGNLGRGKISLDKRYYIKSDQKIDEDDLIQYGDLFFNTRNTLDLVGKVAIWNNELPVAYYNSNLMRITFDNNFYMNYCLNSYSQLAKLRGYATGTTSVAAIYTRDLLCMKLPYPTLPEQQKIATFLTALDQRIDKVSQQIEGMKEWKKGLLGKMFV